MDHPDALSVERSRAAVLGTTLVMTLVIGMTTATIGGAQPVQSARDSRPFAPGERLQYEVRYAGIRAGAGSIGVEGTARDTVPAGG